MEANGFVVKGDNRLFPSQHILSLIKGSLRSVRCTIFTDRILGLVPQPPH